LGDYLDRREDALATIETLANLAESCHCIFLRGNHDEAWPERAVICFWTFSQVTLESSTFSQVMLEFSHGVAAGTACQARNLAFSHLELRWKSHSLCDFQRIVIPCGPHGVTRTVPLSRYLPNGQRRRFVRVLDPSLTSGTAVEAGVLRLVSWLPEASALAAGYSRRSARSRRTNGR
jgi:hypothetical protein